MEVKIMGKKKTTEEVVEEVKVEETPAPVEEKKEAPKKVKIAKF